MRTPDYEVGRGRTWGRAVLEPVSVVRKKKNKDEISIFGSFSPSTVKRQSLVEP